MDASFYERGRHLQLEQAIAKLRRHVQLLIWLRKNMAAGSPGMSPGNMWSAGVPRFGSLWPMNCSQPQD
jgi:hypothetical protein